MEEEKKDPVTYSDEDLKKLEDDIKKASGEDQKAKVEAAIKETKEKIAEQRAQEELKKQLAELKKQQEEEKVRYAESLEQLKKEQEENTKKLIEEFRAERQSTVNTQNPVKNGNSDDAEALKKKVREDPNFLKEIDEKSRDAFFQEHGLRGWKN